MNNFLHEYRYDCPILTLLYVLIVLNVLNILKEASLACWAFFRYSKTSLDRISRDPLYFADKAEIRYSRFIDSQ